jgi:hypothetical protein
MGPPRAPTGGGGPAKGTSQLRAERGLAKQDEPKKKKPSPLKGRT